MPSTPEEIAAWRRFCQRIERVGEQLLDQEYPSGPADRVEGVAHLAEQVVCWLEWAVHHRDPGAPMFQRQNDLVKRWGGPNIDNVYRHARVDPSHRYRIRGRMHGCEDFILTVRAGFMHMETWGTLHEVTASELGIGPGDDFELQLGGDPGAGALPLPDGAAMVTVREFYLDWRVREPATFVIECLDGERSGMTAASLLAGLDEAAAQVEHSLGHWNRYLIEARARQRDNTFAPPLTVAKGLSAARYTFCFYDLQPDEALVVDSDVPDARYWSFQIYALGWFEPVDVTTRITSLNHRQARVEDGRVQVVLASSDPGVPNWLDVSGRPQGLLTFRFFWPARAPTPTARLVQVGELATGGVDRDRRAEEVRRRREHLAWRFRT